VRQLVQAGPARDEELRSAVAVEVGGDEAVLPDRDLDPGAAERVGTCRIVGPASMIVCPDPSGPIGVFDSGVGGLSVLRHVRALLPHEDLLYVADSGHAPYGDRSPSWIRARSLQLAQWLASQRAKAIVVACNTATAAAASALRAHLALPIIAMEPAVKPAAAATRTGVVGVLATTGTLESARFAALLDRFAANVDVVTQACPGLVERIERGELDTPSTRALVASFVAPLLARGAETIVLGCTHYPFVRDAITAATGPEVTLVETGAAVAREVSRRLAAAGLLAPADRAGRAGLLTTGGARAAEAARRLWPQADAVGTRPGEYVLRLTRRTDRFEEEPIEDSEELPFTLRGDIDDPANLAEVRAYLAGCEHPAEGAPERGPCDAIGLLGFSERGAIALVYSAGNGERRLAVRNLANDAVLSDVPFGQLAPVVPVLRKTGIRTVMPEEACTAPGAPFQAFIEGDSVLFSRRGETKRIARLPAHPPGAAAPRVLGCLRSPFEPRVAVFVEVAAPRGGRTVQVAGAHLEAGFEMCAAGSCVSCAGTPASFEQVSVRRNGCGIAPGGALACWGRMRLGRPAAGGGSLPPAWIPGQWAQVAVSARFACAIASDGGLWCFGDLAPARIGAERWKKLAAGAGGDGHPPDHFCGIQEDGSMWCWGAPSDDPPDRIGTSADWTDVAVSDAKSCGIRAPGALYCWGDGDPRPYRQGDADDWVRVRVGGPQVCGLRSSGAAHCFGRYAQAGIKLPDDNPSWEARDPVRIGDGRFTAIATGEYHTCAIREDGTLWCWGENRRGQLGRAPGGVSLPEKVGSSGGWLDVAAGTEETCARRKDGFWCFGWVSDNSSPGAPPPAAPPPVSSALRPQSRESVTQANLDGRALPSSRPQSAEPWKPRPSGGGRAGAALLRFECAGDLFRPAVRVPEWAICS